MPLILTIRVAPGLWIAWTENNSRERSSIRRGISEQHATRRSLAALAVTA